MVSNPSSPRAAPDDLDRKRRGAWFTPPHLVDAVVAAAVDARVVDACGDRPVRIVDPACGDGRFLVAAMAAVEAAGGRAHAVGVDIDRSAVEAARAAGVTETQCANALDDDWLAARSGTFDVVIGNPPYLSQMSSLTTRGRSSERGGGPYADAAAEFLALGADLVHPDGGRLAYVLPQSILSARDAHAMRQRIDDRATMIWSTWTGQRDFDAQVVTCALVFCFGVGDAAASGNWSHVVTSRIGVPPVPGACVEPGTAGVLGDRARLNANFRDEYYGMIPAVGDHRAGPPLVTSGLIDPGHCLWGARTVRFAKQRFTAPRVDVDRLDAKMTKWATDRLVPKVLIANQTPIVEAVCDPTGEWLPAVPVVAAYPNDFATATETAWEIAALLTSPAVSVWAWHQRGGTGLSATTIRVGPTMLADLAWPAGSLADAVERLRRGDVVGCGDAVDRAYGLSSDEHEEASEWWRRALDRIEARR